MRLSRRNVVIGSCSAAAAAGVAAAAVLLTGNSSPAKGHLPQRAAQAAVPLVSPFTGEPVRALGPVLAVKIDNIVLARPQTGLTKADIVYVIPVEGRLSRFLAVFSSHFPPVIGPVRSARADDLELLRQFGTPAFAFSGAQPQLLPVIEHARIVDLYDSRVGGYYRGPNRVAPTTCMPAPSGCSPRPRTRAGRTASASGSAPPRPTGSRRPLTRSVIGRLPSASAGPRSRPDGWYGWTAPRPPRLRTGSSAPRLW